jgi:hypothetical protein
MTDAIVNLINRAEPEKFIALLLVFACGVLLGAVAIISHHWFAHRQREMDITLKREMIAGGMSVDEIERVLAARTPMQSIVPSGSDRIALQDRIPGNA